MGLPTGRDLTATALSPLPSALTNHIQDEIVRLHQRTTGVLNATSGGAPVAFADAITLAGGVTGAVAATGNVSGANLTTPGDVTVGDDVIASGVVSGLELYHTTVRMKTWSGCSPVAGSSWAQTLQGGVGLGIYYVRTGTDALDLLCHLDAMEEGSRIVSWEVDWQNDSTDRTLQAFLSRSTNPVDGFEPLDGLNLALGSGRARSHNLTLNHDIVPGETYTVQISNTASANAGAMRFYKVILGIKRPPP